MQEFEFHSPTELVFGRNTESQTGRLCAKYGAKTVLLVYGGGSVVRSGLLGRVRASLDGAGLTYAEHGGVHPNPRLSFAEEGVRKALSAGADFILALGGGSAIDTAKAIAIGAANQEADIWPFWMHQREVTKALKVGAVLTIPAAGSESSDSAVLTNEATGVKKGLSTDFNRPAFAVMNPELTYTLPDYQVACGIVDIMMHTLERYFVKPGAEADDMTDALAEELLRTVISNGRIAHQDKTDYHAMSELMYCGSLSHNGITGLGRPRDFGVHGLGHALSARYDEAHGASLSALWPSWARTAYQVNPERFAHYGAAVWGIDPQIGDAKSQALAAIDKTEMYFRSLDMPVRISELAAGKLSDQTLHELADLATAGDTNTLGAYYPMHVQEAYEVYQLANES